MSGEVIFSSARAWWSAHLCESVDSGGGLAGWRDDLLLEGQWARGSLALILSRGEVTDVVLASHENTAQIIDTPPGCV